MRLGFVFLIGVRDLQWRRRRFVMAIAAVSLVFAITLLLAGIGAGFGVEARQLVDELDADGYVVTAEARGPFMSPRPFSADAVDLVAATPGVTKASPLIATIQPDFYLLAQPGGTEGAVTADARLGLRVGDELRVGVSQFRVGAVTRGETVLGGQPLVRLTIDDANRALFAGHALVTSVAVKGVPTGPLPAGLTYVSRAGAYDDLMRPLGVVLRTIQMVSVLLWIVAAAIVGSVVYVSTLERLRDLSVFKATGAATGDLLVALVLQAVLIALGASVIAIGMTYAIAPLSPAAASFPARLLLLLPALASVVGLLASSAGLRRAVRVDPALAMGSPG